METCKGSEKQVSGIYSLTDALQLFQQRHLWKTLTDSKEFCFWKWYSQFNCGRKKRCCDVLGKDITSSEKRNIHCDL